MIEFVTNPIYVSAEDLIIDEADTSIVRRVNVLANEWAEVLINRMTKCSSFPLARRAV